MCGIAGLFDTRMRREPPEALLARMTDVQAHRGPDGRGLHREPGVGLGHRRLSIIDLAGGAQPMCNEDGTVWVTYNGEIYNFRELAAELARLGHRFRTRCDTEVIVHAWEQWGERCVERFRGMFAFAVWDRGAGTLFLARDRLGIKPLHYALLPDGWLAFGSELKALAVLPALPRGLDESAVEDYLALGYVPDPKTIYAAARKLPPAHTLTVRRGRPLPAPRRYWRPVFEAGARIAPAAAAESLAERLREAVRIRLVAEVPLGAFLSGGVDSSSVVAMMAAESEGPVRTCAIAFDEAGFDESEHAARVARHCGTEHHVERVRPDDLCLVDELAGLYDEPFADSSALPTWKVCELARRHVTVALSGDGGDECYAGYRRYRWHMREERVRRLLPLALRRALFGPLGRAYPKLDRAPRPLRAKTTLQALARDSLEAYFENFALLPAPLRRRLASERLRRRLAGYRALEVMRAHAAEAPEHPLSRVQYVDLMTYLPGDILTKVDRASMAHALEVRVPVLDHRLVEWACSLPPELKLRGMEGKWILKKAMEPWLPHEILYRPKMGFAVPLARWFRGPLRDRVRAALLGPVLGDAGLVDRATVAALVDDHLAGRRDHSAAIWALLMLEAFLRREAGEPAREAPAALAGGAA